MPRIGRFGPFRGFRRVHGFRQFRRGERGAVAAVLVVLLGAGVLLGTGALVVDVGQIYAEREQLQSGADAAAIALARTCAAAPASCAGQATTAVRYANGNAKDGVSAVSVICGTAPGLSTCPAPDQGLSACLGTPPTTPYVEVRTATQLSDGRTVLPPTFASTLSGMANYAGRTIRACARAMYGTPATLRSASVTISQCEWTALTAGGTNLAPPPTIGIPAPSAEGVLYLHDPHGSNPSNCPTQSGGMTAPGGFGWLTDTAGPCDTTTTVNTIIAGDTGTNTSAACTTVLASVWSSHTPLMMPIFDTVTDSGSNTTYHITGFSMFVLTGYKLGSDSKPSWLTGRNSCTGGSRCLYGYFSTAVLFSNGPFTTTNFGVSAITLVG